MQIPETISLDLIDLGDRGRTTYSRIEELAQSIRDNGLIQPIVLVPLPWRAMYGIDAGGRRFRAVQLLGGSVLYHATTSDPARPGFVLKGEDQATPLKRLLTEIAENLDRENMDWRDQTSLLTKAYRLAENEANVEGKHILMRDFGAMLGVGYAELQAACSIHDDLIANPERYKGCEGIRAAYTVLLNVNKEVVTRMAAAKDLAETPRYIKDIDEAQAAEVAAQPVPEREGVIDIPLTKFFHHTDGLEFMRGLPNASVDHIITDPDYGVSVERLEAGVVGAESGVHQESIEKSLSDLYAFIRESWRILKPQSFLVFWYDLDHHEKLQRTASDFGFIVQRWPLIWWKAGYHSNAAPAHNFCKNIEYAMVCRKPNATLAKQPQLSSVYHCPAGPVVRELGHPFAKPYELWQWIYSAVCIKGQAPLDPFMGRASASIAALRWGLRPVGCEINEEHYYGALFNLQNAYKKELGSNVTFS